jgi:lysophospholipase L1-like esterase
MTNLSCKAAYFKLKFFLAIVLFFFTGICSGQTYKVHFPLEKLVNGYFTIHNIPDGNYLVKLKAGSMEQPGNTIIRGESRRLLYEAIETRKGEFKEISFTVNKRNTRINDSIFVLIKEREKKKLNWDNDLTFEFSGKNPQVAEIEIHYVSDVTTVFLCGNSTVTDQDNEPWASWGQMIPCFFNENTCFANYAESGESVSSFIASKRFAKILARIKPGDYVFIEFGHNDQKQKGDGMGPYLNFYKNLRFMLNEVRGKGAFPVLVTPTQRRSFNSEEKIIETHGEYPDAMRHLATEENVPLLDLHLSTRILYEKLGIENSRRAFVHYPANTFPNQPKALEDNTHFNPYGAYQIAKCVVEGIKQLKLPIAKYIRNTYIPYDPSHPDNPEKFIWYPSPFFEVEKPDGN